MSLTRETAWRVLANRILKGIVIAGIVVAILTLPQPYPCETCKKTGFTPGSNDKVPCGRCGGDGRISLWQRFSGN